MSTQLDPVTGAPLLTPDLGNIDQLPYKVQPVPLQDQTNQPQLGRPYLYPDDVPPVLANINAMNGTQPDQAQTLHTDGEHRLLVASSGGGGGPVPVKYASNSGGYTSFGNGFHLLGQFGAPSTLYQARLDYAWDGTGSFPITGPILSLLCKPDGTNGIVIGEANMYISSATTGVGQAGVIDVEFNPPLDVALSGISNGTNMGFAVNNQTGLSFTFGWSFLHS